MIKVTFQEDARLELVETSRYYEDRLSDLGYLFTDNVEKGVNEIVEMFIEKQINCKYF